VQIQCLIGADDGFEVDTLVVDSLRTLARPIKLEQLRSVHNSAENIIIIVLGATHHLYTHVEMSHRTCAPERLWLMSLHCCLL
jgi:hypothetical protein